MREIIFEKIYKYGFMKGHEVDRQAIASMPIKKMIDFAHEFRDITIPNKHERQDTIWTHSASFSLSGSDRSGYCTDCRLERVNQLSQFAALYSDKVFIRNYMDDFLVGYRDSNETIIKNRFYDDLHVLSKMRTLIDRGIITLLSTSWNFCPGCYSFLIKNDHEHAFKDIETFDVLGEKRRVEKSFNRLSKHLLDNISVDISKKDGHYSFHIVGPKDIIEHGVERRYYIDDKIPEQISNMPELLAEVNNGKTVSLSKELIKKLKYHEMFLYDIYCSIGFELVSAQCLNTSILTDSELQIDIINKMNNNNDILKRNYLLNKHMKSIVPFIKSVDISDIIKIREREGEAFVMFRKALNEAIDENNKIKRKFTEKDAIELYSDVIMPRLAALDRKLKSAQREFRTSLSRKVIGWVGSISFGIYTGFIPSELVVAAKTLGFTKVVADLLEHTMNKSDAEECIKSEDMYFLWKVENVKYK